MFRLLCVLIGTAEPAGSDGTDNGLEIVRSDPRVNAGRQDAGNRLMVESTAIPLRPTFNRMTVRVGNMIKEANNEPVPFDAPPPPQAERCCRKAKTTRSA